ncbi:NmrA family NAD(P)-binding protein [Clostridium polynesiense]|uniref:NmrA family NAD(P)-binding protein n=1 Tax=Clostridium polynesiense TaxID=1325933 RepID=UPI0005902BAB|nr:NmrA family NAD(P)-binding protein [Clostridium polynesiense]
MNIILGATGQIGSMVVDNLLEKGEAVRAVVRDELKAQSLKEKGAEVAVADYFYGEELKKAFKGGSTVFLLTPENPFGEDFIGDIEKIIKNYREAVISSGIDKIVGLSSMGAQNPSGTGNLEASYLLEHGFSDIEAELIFVRSAYYFSNWLAYLEMAENQGILPTFFPPDMKLPMIAPPDTAKFLSDIIASHSPQERIYEIEGPCAYTSLDIAEIFQEVLNRKVTLNQIMAEEWEDTFMQSGFSKDGTENLMLMTKAVIDGKTHKEMDNIIQMPTDFKSYLINTLK